MIISFDDTGTPIEGERFIVTAVYIRPSTWSSVLCAFERWEKLTRRKIQDRPLEIKSTRLTDDLYKDFVNQVAFCAGSDIWYLAYAIDVDSHAIEWSKKQFQVYVDEYAKAIEIAQKDPNRQKWAKQSQTLMGWIRKTPSVYAIKMQVINMAISDSINNAIGISTVNGYDNELSDLRVFIDLGFIKDKATMFWKEMLRNHIAQTPVVAVEGWPDDHPFYSTFVKETRGNISMFNNEFSKRMDFYDSSVCPEVQIADIFSGLMRKKYIEQVDTPYIERLKALKARRDRDCTMFKFGDLSQFESKIKLPNPYDEFNKRGVKL